VTGAAACLLGVALAAPADASLLARRLDAYLQAQAAAGFSGSVLVVVQGRVVIDHGYGVPAGSRFWIASLGKPFTAAALLRAQEKGLLSLDDPISRHLPRVPTDKKGVTVRHLLAHVSGFPPSDAAEGAVAREQAAAILLALPLTSEPGTRFQYSNVNYQLAAAVVETASRRPYADFVQREVLRRAGLRRTGQAGTPGGADVLPGQGKVPARLRSASWGGQGYYSTTRDLYAWTTALLGGRVLSSRSLAEMFAGVTEAGDGVAALGWFVDRTARGHTRFYVRGHDHFGPSGMIATYPQERATVIVLSHAGRKGGRDYAEVVQDGLERVLGY
jgi:CubicO group peptidase (beta-lactamase class C family)